MPSELTDNPARKQALLELRYALIATAITLVGATALYLVVPRMQEAMRELDESLEHERLFEKTATGGNIEYQVQERPDISAEDQLTAYTHDLEILSRRFKSGRFEMVNIPGMTTTEEYAGMVRVRDTLRYRVYQKNDAAVLEIRVQNPGALPAVHAYLDYLAQRWRFKRTG
ncbi:MAG: hypothetical protein H7A21_13645 [Spirochaetales bacterium]|nr:hypothetical protein [Leptospiraceae bacterium]MCP5482474.1 hypothetical protein [Spirochaetales bacterium]MCP5485822.1 hypothetical protein [Spirochaetales bacterium]